MPTRKPRTSSRSSKSPTPSGRPPRGLSWGSPENSRTSSGVRFSTRDFAVDQSVNLRDMGSQSEVREFNSLRSSVTGLFRMSNISLNSRRSTFDEYGDASPMTESEEYLKVDRRRRLTPLWNCIRDSCDRLCTSGVVTLLCVLVGIGLSSYGLYVLLQENNWKRAETIREFIIESNVSSQEVFDASGSNPQKQALDWIVKKDNSKLDVDHEALLERYILTVFYFSSEPSQWDKTGGWLTDAGHCSWYGVHCVPREDETEDSGISKTYDDSDHITTLNLASNGLSGTIPPELGKLSNTLTLDLSDNRISGDLPDFHPNLRYLSVGKNSLAGEIPKSITKLTNLHGLDLSQNRFEGAVSADVGKLEELRYLILSGNRLSGPFPDIKKLVKMTKLYLDDNSFTGTIPTYLREFERLAELRVGKNQLEGAFPTETLEAIPSLEVLSIGDNKFTGTIPNIFDHIHRLTDLHLNNNRLNGVIPKSIGHMSALTALRLDNNQLTGTIPDNFALLADIEVIALNDNHLSGSIPSFIGHLDDIRYLSLKGNKLTGTIPTELGTCFRLSNLHLQKNKLTGEIPSQLGDLELLSKLNLEKNSFLGISMPVQICNLVSVGEMSALSADCKDAGKVSCTCCNTCYPVA